MSNHTSRNRFSVASNVTEEARKAMNTAIDSFSTWRDEFATQSEKNSKAVFDQMATAAKSFGWPAEFVEMTRQQMMSASKMQLQFMDQVMDIWEQQLKNPGSAFKMPESWTNMMQNLPNMGGMSFPGMPGAGSFPGFGNMPGMPGMLNPFQFWMQAAEMWQKSWQNAMQSWTDMQNSGRR